MSGHLRIDGISAERVRDALDYDPITGVFIWKNPNKFGPRKAGARAGNQRPDGYRSIMIDYIRYFEHHLAWLHFFGSRPTDEIDHINLDPSDNRICNLRLATRSENERNKYAPSHNTSGQRGVVWCESRGLWQAQIVLNKKSHFLGRFNTKDAAIAARIKAEERMFGEFAR